jgi:cyanophycinase
VTVVDASGLSYTDCERVTAPQPVALLGLRLDVLNAGCVYDLASRRAVPPGGASERPAREGPAREGSAREGSASAPDGARFVRDRLLATAGETIA